MIRVIERYYYRLFTYSPLYMGVYGKFKVLYSDGKKSMPMDYKTAKDYAEMFDGKIIDNF